MSATWTTVVVLDPTGHLAATVLGVDVSEVLAGTQSSALGDAVEWLSEWRAAHPGEVPAAQLLGDAEEAGIATMTLHRARKQLGLRTRQTGGGWVIF